MMFYNVFFFEVALQNSGGNGICCMRMGTLAQTLAPKCLLHFCSFHGRRGKHIQYIASIFFLISKHQQQPFNCVVSLAANRSHIPCRLLARQSWSFDGSVKQRPCVGINTSRPQHVNRAVPGRFCVMCPCSVSWC